MHELAGQLIGDFEPGLQRRIKRTKVNDNVAFRKLNIIIEHNLNNNHFKNDDWHVYTPIALTAEILFNIKRRSDKTFLVFYNAEMVPVLHYLYDVPFENITLVCINKKQVKYNKELFQGKVNIILLDPAQIKTTKVFKDMKFDNIVGNPPYQSGNQKIYQKFYNKATELTKPGGTIALISPSPILRAIITGKFKGSVKINPTDIIYADYSSRVKNTFFKNVGTSICYFIARNEVTNIKPTVVVDSGTYNNIQISTMLPQEYGTVKTSIESKCFAAGARQIPIDNTSISSNSITDNTGNITVVSHIDKNNNFVTKKVSCDIPHKDAGVNRVFITQYGDKCKAVKDTSLLPSLDRMIYTLRTNSLNESLNAEFILRESNLSKYYKQVYKPRAHMVDFIMNCRTSIDFNTVKSDAELYKHFKLTKEEIAYVEANVK